MLPPNPPSCPVLEIPGWWWHLVDVGRHVRSGFLRGDGVSYWTVTQAEEAMAAVDYYTVQHDETQRAIETETAGKNRTAFADALKGARERRSGDTTPQG